MLTIHNLEVQFEVTGDDDAVFARLFAAHIQRWSQCMADERSRALDAARERSINGDPVQEDR